VTFFQWLMLYSNIISELIGEDREEAMAVMDDDAAFDRWMKRYEQQQKMASRSKGKKTAVDQETYLKRYAVVVGDEEGG
jgi:hypothetical protein